MTFLGNLRSDVPHIELVEAGAESRRSGHATCPPNFVGQHSQAWHGMRVKPLPSLAEMAECPRLSVWPILRTIAMAIAEPWTDIAGSIPLSFGRTEGLVNF